MVSVKRLLGKVVSNPAGQPVGTVSGLLVDPGPMRLVGLLVTRMGLFRSPQMLYWQDALLGEGRLTVESVNVLRPLSEIAPSWWSTHREPGLWGRPLYDNAGGFLGLLSDLMIDRRGRVVGCRVSNGVLKDLITGQPELVGTMEMKVDGEGLELVGGDRHQA